MKFNFRWNSAPDPAGGAYSSLPDPQRCLLVRRGKEREGKGGEKRGGRRTHLTHPLSQISGYATGGKPNLCMWIGETTNIITTVL